MAKSLLAKENLFTLNGDIMLCVEIRLVDENGTVVGRDTIAADLVVQKDDGSAYRVYSGSVIMAEMQADKVVNFEKVQADVYVFTVKVNFANTLI